VPRLAPTAICGTSTSAQTAVEPALAVAGIVKIIMPDLRSILPTDKQACNNICYMLTAQTAQTIAHGRQCLRRMAPCAATVEAAEAADAASSVSSASSKKQSAIHPVLEALAGRRTQI
jgi:hypothetical protein